MRAALAALLLVAAAPGGARAECARDDALSRAAAALLRRGGELTPGILGRAAREAGSDAPAVHAIRDAEFDDRRVREFLDELRARADAPIACGEAQGDAGRIVLAAVRAGSLDVQSDDPVRVRGRLADGFDRPELVVRSADGSLVRLGVAVDDLRNGVTLPDGIELPAVVQLVAHGPTGPRPVAERAVGGTPEQPDPGGSELPVRLEHLRRAHHASPLRDNRLLAAEADAHARRVCTSGRVAHTLDAGADPEERLARRGIRARVVGEVVARASSAASAMDALVRSPSHQYTLVDRRFTDAGIGVAEDGDGRSCVVVLLAAWPRYAGR